MTDETPSVPPSDASFTLQQVAQVTHAAIQQLQVIRQEPVWSPWEHCGEGFQQEQIALAADLLDNAELAEQDRYGELRVAILQALA